MHKLLPPASGPGSACADSQAFQPVGSKHQPCTGSTPWPPRSGRVVLLAVIARSSLRRFEGGPFLSAQSREMQMGQHVCSFQQSSKNARPVMCYRVISRPVARYLLLNRGSLMLADEKRIPDTRCSSRCGPPPHSAQLDQ
jgi:hypothetical protein